MQKLFTPLAPLFALLLSSCVSMGQIGHVHAEKSSEKTGILLLAHGGKPGWNEEVRKVAAEVGKTAPVEVAFGMASKRTIQPAVDALVQRGVSEIVAVPLFISSNSSVITSTAFLLGQRADAPADLALFAKMSHGHGDTHAAHGTHESFDPLTPVASKVPIRMVAALDSDPIVAEMLLTRAASISKQPKNEVLVIVAHGPVSDDTNKLWLSDMARLAEMIKKKSDFKRIEYLTVRDDAPEPIRARAAAEFRFIVSGATNEKSSVLIVPLLLSFGGIEEGVRKRLDGLTYTMSPQALLPDARISQWVIESVRKKSR